MHRPDRRGNGSPHRLACSVALLTIYDMCKAVDRGMTISGVRMMEKRGEKRGILWWSQPAIQRHRLHAPYGVVGRFVYPWRRVGCWLRPKRFLRS